MWYGLFKGNRLISVQYFNSRPSTFDFRTCLCSDYDYDIREVDISW